MDVILRRTLSAGVWLVLAGLVALLAAAVFVPRLFGADVYTVLTPSMAPALSPGTLVVVRPTDPDDIGVGSVITFQREPGKAEVVTHRVVRQGVDGRGKLVYLTEGDANDAPDAVWVRPVQVRGTVWYAIPHVGRIATVMPNDAREMLAAGVALGLLTYAGAMFASAARDRRRVSHA